ncbi:MAG: hypothetical protein ACJ781_18845, partial [Myxococcales bacterium]
LPCGAIDPVGITGTPVIDVATDTAIHLVAMTTPNGGSGIRHRLYSLSIKDGSDVRPPVEIAASVPGFNSRVQNQRGALAAAGGRIFVPFAGHSGDCGTYHGWVIGIDPSGAQATQAFQTAPGGGIWGMTGVAGLGGFLFAATGNTIGATAFAFGESIVRFGVGPSFTTAPQFDFYAPANWAALDAGDQDVGASGAIVLTPPGGNLVAAMGKDGNAYLVDPLHLGGVGSSTAVIRQVSTTPIITAPSAINTSAGTFLAFHGSGLGCPPNAKGIVGLRINNAPVDASVAWCASMNGRGSTIVTTTTPGGTNAAESIVWAVGAEGDGQLHGVAADTGAVIFTGGNVGSVSRFSAPIVAKGRIYVAGNSGVSAFTVR